MGLEPFGTELARPCGERQQRRGQAGGAALDLKTEAVFVGYGLTDRSRGLDGQIVPDDTSDVVLPKDSL